MRAFLIPLWLCLSVSSLVFGQDAQAIAEAAKAQGVEVSAEQVKEVLESQRPAQQTPQQVPATTQQPQVQEVTQPPQPASTQGSAPSTIEQLLSGRMPADVSKDLRQFGYEVFSRPVSTFAPITNVPVGPDYVVGPGDSFTITMWGRQNDQIAVTVDRDGKIALPQVGVLSVSGMTFAKLQEYLDSELRRKYQDFKMHITMTRLRAITVYVVGEAVAPGSYTLSSLSTVINALFAAGGPTKNGSLRKIRVLRAGQGPVVLDLYDFLLGGDRGNDVRLADGDTIHIPLIGPVVGVAGNVKRPAIYEMAGPMTLRQVLDLAGGVTYAGWLQHVQVERVEAHSRRIVVDFDLSGPAEPNRPELDTLIQDGDLIKVFPVTDVEQNVIYLEGHVVRPGKYQLKPGMRLSDLLDYETFLPQVNLEYAEVIRLVPPDMHPIVIPFNLGKVLAGDRSQDLRLERFDRVRLYRWDQKGKRSVTISGQVYQPGEYRLVDGMRLKELIDAAGGLQKDAYLQRAILTRRYVDPNGVMQTRQEYVDLGKAMEGDPNNDVVLQDYDELKVLRVPRWAFHDKAVTVSGLVQDPNTYPLYDGMRISGLIVWAGGLQKDAYLQRAILTRRYIDPNGVMQTRQEYVDLGKAMEGDPNNDVVLQDYDELKVLRVPRWAFHDKAVTVSGLVQDPNTYPLYDGMRISGLIVWAGGLQKDAYLQRAILTRRYIDPNGV
ncbi:MAG: SLBB domain-containing protein, partial [Sedimentisphaerales bacterium]|nr:SLBB domain-containing protein [Sedimentisphaerales bacterium]